MMGHHHERGSGRVGGQPRQRGRRVVRVPRGRAAPMVRRAGSRPGRSSASAPGVLAVARLTTGFRSAGRGGARRRVRTGTRPLVRRRAARSGATRARALRGVQSARRRGRRGPDGVGRRTLRTCTRSAAAGRVRRCGRVVRRGPRRCRAVGWSYIAITRTRLVLPQPFGPRITHRSPASTRSETPSRIVTPSRRSTMSSTTRTGPVRTS